MNFSHLIFLRFIQGKNVKSPVLLLTGLPSRCLAHFGFAVTKLVVIDSILNFLEPLDEELS